MSHSKERKQTLKLINQIRKRMAKFITGKELEDAIYDIIWNAKDILLIVSPFIKLDEYFKRLFDKHANNPKIKIFIVFGKNEDEVSRSLSKADFDYFKKFLNIAIIYVPNLHAKYYGNESKGIISSINLYDYSFKNNIEFGVYTTPDIISNLTASLDRNAWDTCLEIVNNNEVIFIKRPMYEKKILSALFGNNYVKSDILYDITENFYYNRNGYNHNRQIKKIKDFPEEVYLGSAPAFRPTREEVEKQTIGYCIRIGIRIPFNPTRPFCEDAFRSWVQFSNRDYPEKYCHKTGKPSYGKTSMKNPIL